MVFTSTIFLFAFLPVSMLAFYVVPARWRAAPLLLGSTVFYAWGEPVLVLLILLTGLFTFVWGRLLVRARGGAGRTRLLAVGIVVALVPIAVFKYLDFALSQVGLDSLADRTRLPLPVGVSFYTFMAIGYLIDIHRRRDDGAPSLLAFSGFLTMYPHLVAGPIVRWHHIGPQLAAPRFDPGLFGYGALRVAGGLAKKAVLADQLALVVDGMFATGEPRSSGAAWVAALLYSLQIYLDFSAYSDIAIGLAAMMGVRFHENFRYPYLAGSAREFWQRWHISLGSWFRDYVYIPLGGSRVRPILLWRNLMLVWALTGLWHGAAWTFVAWGLYYGVLIGLERSVYGEFLARRAAPVQHLYGLGVAVLGWVLFRSTSLSQAAEYYRAMTGLVGDQPWWDATATFAVQRTWVVVLISAALAAGVARPFMDLVERRFARSLAGEPLPDGVSADPADPADPATSSNRPDPATSSSRADPATSSSRPGSAGVAVATRTARTAVIEQRSGDAAPPVHPALAVGVAVLAVGLLLLASAFIIATTYSPFIYFRF
jgi:alginate O-acetyltransferase complex protein AlgI